MTSRPHEHNGLQAEAIRILTRAANASASSTNGLDFADFLAQVLASTAANVGGTDRLLARRPGSWEASHVEALLRGTVGDEPDSWCTYRTEPLIVPLNVAELIESGDCHPGLLGLDDAIDAVGLRYSSADDEDDAVLDAWDWDIEVLIERYRTEYRSYATRFAARASTLGKAMTPPVDVILTVDVDPTSPWWKGAPVTNPTEAEAEPLAVAIWNAAHDGVALPNVDIGQVLSNAGGR